MAAVLCKGIGDICTGICKCTGAVCHTICVTPCKLCASSCGGMADVCASPFAVFVAFAVIAQLPPIVVGLMEVTGIPNCRGSVWLIGAIVLGAINIAAACYLAVQIRNTQDPNLQHLQSAVARATHLLCHDPWMAAYILVLLIFFVWLCLGATWSLSGLMDEDESCSDSILRSTRIAACFGWFYVFGGSAVLALSFCCACCDQRNYGATTTQATPDVENPNSPQPPPPPFAAQQQQQQQQEYETQKPQAAASSTTQPAMFSADGKPINTKVHEEEIPVAYAEAIPTPAPPPMTPSAPQASAPPSDYDLNFSTSATSGVKTSGTSEAKEEERKAANDGSSMGKKVGKLLKIDEAKQQELERKGKQAKQAVGKGFLNAKNFVQSKLNKKNDSAADKK
jgi:hypothetical protein